MTTLFAQPHIPNVPGFTFTQLRQFHEHTHRNQRRFGKDAYLYAIQFIDGDAIDKELFEAADVRQGDLARFFEVVHHWSKRDKIRLIITVREYSVSFANVRSPIELTVEVFDDMDSTLDLAAHLLDEDVFGTVPPFLRPYIDLSALGLYLDQYYDETTIAGRNVLFRRA